MKLMGKKALITGGGQGFGLAVAEAFVKEGAEVAIGGRHAPILKKAVEQLKALALPDQKILWICVDVSKPKEVEQFVSKSLEFLGSAQILVNNAGVYGPMGPFEEADWEEWVSAIQINLLGTGLLCRALLPHFKRQKYGKIINLSGGGATAPLPRFSAYAASKAAVVRLTETLAEECRGNGIDINAIAPGALNTRLLDQVLTSGPDKVGKDFYDKSLKQREEGGVSLERGAALCVYLASSLSDGITGKLISAVWDPWEKLEQHREVLAKTDVYGLRRIVPKDRGLLWG